MNKLDLMGSQIPRDRYISLYDVHTRSSMMSACSYVFEAKRLEPFFFSSPPLLLLHASHNRDLIGGVSQGASKGERELDFRGSPVQHSVTPSKHILMN